MQKHKKRYPLSFSRLLLITALLGSLAVLAGTEVLFTKPVDKRLAWLGNDAQGEVDFPARIISLINSATTSIDVATMSFSGQDAIAAALAAKAQSGVQVRLIVNRGHRTQSSVMRSLHGPVMIADNNLGALVARVNFQESGSLVPPGGWLEDNGLPFGPRPGGYSYGWNVNVSADISSFNPATYPSSLLGHVYAHPNNTSNTWEFALPNGFYYVHLVVGEPDFGTKNYIQVENQNIFRIVDFWGQYLNCGPDEFKGATVEGGEEAGFPNSRRIQVTDGRLSVRVGEPGQSGWSSIAYVEIYRGSSTPLGDDFTNVSMVQESGLHHSKYILVDGNTATPQLWASSGNLTTSIAPGGRSEDAILTDEISICNAFRDQFQQQWGGPMNPDPASSRFSRFKLNPSSSSMVFNPYLGASFPWTVHFTPSVDGLNMASILDNFINPTSRELIFMLEQFTNSGPAFGQNSSGFLMNSSVMDKLDANIPLYGVFGDAPGSVIYTVYGGKPAYIGQSDEMHNKVLLRDALRDTRFTREGQMVAGSMNWSQSGMHRNDEQLLLIQDPAVVNQYLQRAMNELDDKGVSIDDRVDLILILDRSFSMNALCSDGVTSMIAAARMAGNLFLDIMEKDAGHRVSLVRFGEWVEPFVPAVSLQPLTPAWEGTLNTAISGTVANLPIGNATCYGCALEESLNQMQSAASPRPRRIVHFFTDGKQNKNPMAEGVYPDLDAAGIEIHSTAFQPFDLFNGNATSILEEMATETGGTFEQVPNNSTLLRKRFVEVARRAMGLDMLLDPSYLIRPRQTVWESLDVDASAKSLKFLSIWQSDNPYQVAMKLVTPDGTTLKDGMKGLRVTNQDGHVCWHLDLVSLSKSYGIETEGSWRIGLSSGPKFAYDQLPVDLMVLGDTDVDFRAEVIRDPKDPHQVQLLARMLFENEGLTKGSIVADWSLPIMEVQSTANISRVALFDDGKHGDGKADDGLFGAQLTLKEPGNHRFHFIAEMAVPGQKLEFTQQRREAHVAATVNPK